jgi:hypothetical protein
MQPVSENKVMTGDPHGVVDDGSHSHLHSPAGADTSAFPSEAGVGSY